MKKAFFLITSFVLTVSLTAQQNSCDPSISINIDSQNSTEVVYSVSGPALNMNANFSWVYFSMGGMCIGGSAHNSPSDTISLSNNLPDSTEIWCMISDSITSCIVKDTLVYDSLTGWSMTPSNFLSTQTYVPDDNFEQALIDQGYDDTLDNYVYTDSITQITFLYIINKNISDLTGIEGFTSLIFLHCAQNNLDSIDLSSNIALEKLYCAQNNLDSIDLSSNIALEELYCSSNSLDSIDLSSNIALKELSIHYNNLTTLDLNQNTSLEYLSCGSNRLTFLDLSHNINIEKVLANGNYLQYLNLNNCINLTSLRCDGNQSLQTLDLTDNINLEFFRCSMTSIGTLDVSHLLNLKSLHAFQTHLTYLNINNNQQLQYLSFSNLDTIDISNNLSLKQLYFYGSQIEEIDVSQHTQLQALRIHGNKLKKLDVSNNQLLDYLDCSNNLIDSLDITHNPLLESLLCGSTSLVYLDLRNGNNHNMFSQPGYTWYCGNAAWTYPKSFGIFNNPNLYCISVDNIFYSDTAWIKDPWAIFSNSCQNEIEGCADTLALNYDSTSTTNTFCDYGITLVPDSVFEYYLETHNIAGVNVPIGNTSMGDGILGNDTVLTKNIRYKKNLSSLGGSRTLFHQSPLLWHPNIEDLTGIEDFISLEWLVVNNNRLTSLDLSNNSSLVMLDCRNNDLISLDIRNNNNINMITWYGSIPAAFNITDNPNLQCINVDDSTFSANNWTYIDSTTFFNNNCEAVFGCLDSLACNYNSTAFIDDGSCFYPSIDTTELSSCNSYTWQRNGTTYYLSGIYTDSLINSNGCDSVLFLDLTITNTNNTTTTIDSLNACGGMLLNGTYYSTSGTHMQIDSVSQCDTFFTILNLNIIGDHTYSYDTATAQDIFIWNGLTLISSGDYSKIFTNTIGCDSIAYLNLTITTQTAILENQRERKIIKITDILGKESPARKNTPMLYIYNDGTVERKIIIE